EHAGNEQTERQIHDADMQGYANVGSLDVTKIDAEHQDQADLGDEKNAEEEGETAQRISATPFERQVIDLIDERAECIESRQHDNADDDRVDAQPLIDDVSNVGAENDEGGMRDVDDIEDAEGNRNADGDRGVKSAEQKARDQRAHQQI